MKCDCACDKAKKKETILLSYLYNFFLKRQMLNGVKATIKFLLNVVA